MNGHVVNDCTKSDPDSNRKFCRDCGEKTITNCTDCDKEIQGYHHIENVFGHGYTCPTYCEDCGSAHPWTKSRIAALKELFDELGIEETDKSKLYETVKDLVRETTRTELAANRFRVIFNKIKPEHKKIVENIAVNVICEPAKKLIFGELGA